MAGNSNETETLAPKSESANPNTGLFPGEIAIELGDHKCSDILFPPLKKALRGRWERGNFSGSFNGQENPRLTKLEVISGAYVCVDVASGKARVFDPLTTPAKQGELEQAADAFVDLNMKIVPFKTITLDRLSQDQLATWVHWMREMVSRKKARHVDGSKPLPDKNPQGRVKLDFFNSNPSAPKHQDDIAAMVR